MIYSSIGLLLGKYSSHDNVDRKLKRRRWNPQTRNFICPALSLDIHCPLDCYIDYNGLKLLDVLVV